MPYKGITKIKGKCAICKTGLPPGLEVYHDPSKRQGSHLAHVGCWEELLESRGGAGAQINKRGSKKGSERSVEALDPPF